MIKNILLIFTIFIAACSQVKLPSIDEIPVPESAENVKKGKGLAYLSYQVSYEIKSLFPDDGYSDFTEKQLLTKSWEKCKGLPENSAGWGPFIDATKGQNQIIFSNMDVYKHIKNKQLLFISGRFNSENYSAEGKLQNIQVVIVVNNLERVDDIMKGSQGIADCS